jgi:pimeloyl-ACP methyl ester carboxylesterase
VPADPALGSLDGVRGTLLPPDGELPFPRAAEALGPETVRSLALLSTLVGMVAPGLHSIFSGFQVAFGETDVGKGLAYTVSRVDERFRLVAIDVSGAGFSGSLRAFARLPPVETPSLAALAAVVGPGEFAGQRALIVGGSRGLGAVTGKLIAAGGGTVTLTYLRGRAEAEAIAAEIGAERCRILAYDTGEEPGAQLAGIGEPFTHVYYFASGRIFGPAGGAVFDAAKFEGFVAVYVTAFERLVGYLLGRWPEAELSVFYPSSVAVETRPKGITEYAMAKAAGEILCTDLGAAHRRLKVAVPRLPRIMTDQTATVPPVPAADPVETMLALLRAK